MNYTVFTDDEEEPAFLADLEPGIPLVLTGISWEEYLDLSERMSHRRLQTTYCDGEFEVFPASFEHATRVSLLDRFFYTVLDECCIDYLSAGRSTLRRSDLKIALEPDRSYYLKNWSVISRKKEIDLPRDPPPDLVIDVDIPNHSARHMRVLAGLGVPEVWRYDGQFLSVHLLLGGEYTVVDRSDCCPFLPMNEVVRFMQLQNQMEENALVRSFREWVRQQIAAGWGAKTGS